MDINVNDLLGSNEFLEYLHKNARQRAALMAVIAKLLQEEDEELTVRNVKIMLCNFFSRQIDEGNMVCDEIESDVMKYVITFLQQETLVEQFNQ